MILPSPKSKKSKTLWATILRSETELKQQYPQYVEKISEWRRHLFKVLENIYIENSTLHFERLSQICQAINQWDIPDEMKAQLNHVRKELNQALLSKDIRWDDEPSQKIERMYFSAPPKPVPTDDFYIYIGLDPFSNRHGKIGLYQCNKKDLEHNLIDYPGNDDLIAYACQNLAFKNDIFFVHLLITMLDCNSSKIKSQFVLNRFKELLINYDQLEKGIEVLQNIINTDMPTKNKSLLEKTLDFLEKNSQ